MAINITKTSATWDGPEDLPEVITKLSKMLQYTRMNKREFEAELADKQRQIDRDAAEKAELQAEYDKKFPGGK